jgi:hypothetical protein
MNKYSATFLAYLYNYIEKSKLASDEYGDGYGV